jgi:hypothetical protein
MKPTPTPLDTPLDDVVTPNETPLRPRKLGFRVSGARLGTVVRPVPSADELAGGVAVAGAVAAPRFGLRAHGSPLAPVVRAPISRDDYATADDYE